MHSIDEEIVRLIMSGDQKGASLLYDHYAHVLYGVLLKGCGQEVIAGQLLQKTIRLVCSSSRQFDPLREHFLTWLLRQARQQLHDYRQLEGDIYGVNDIGELTGLMKQHGDTAHGDVCAKMLELTYYKGYTARHLAEVTGLSEEIVRMNIRKGLKNVTEPGS